MYSIKFKSYSEEVTFPLYETLTDRNNKKNADRATTISLAEGTGIWHRLFHVFNKDEFNELEKFYGLHDIDNDKYYHLPGMYPGSVLEDMNSDEEVSEYPLEFEMLTYSDVNGKEHVCILLNVECYIMNESGQTVDQIVI